MRSNRWIWLLASGALLAGADLRTGWWRGREITYKIVNGIGVYQGDILLGPIEGIPQSPPGGDGKSGDVRGATFTAFSDSLWPNGVVPYIIDSGVPNALRQNIMAAIQIYQSNTPIQWVGRTSERNYARFLAEPASANECGSSFVGVQGGRQDINLNVDTATCGVGTAIHEMGHTIGFEHEQTRANRDFYVHVRYENIDKNEAVQFDQAPAFQLDLLPYEYGSIMHYGVDDFQRKPFNTIDTIPLGIPISHRKNLSAGDIEAVRTIYGKPSSTTVVASNPPGLQLTIDGVTQTTPQTLNWAAGTGHVLGVPGGPQAGGSGTRYVFARWSNDGAATQTIVAAPENRILTANFSAQYLLRSSVSGGGGTVSVNPPSADGYYTQGTLVTITAQPAPGNAFAFWTGNGDFGPFSNLGFTSNPVTFTVNGSGSNYVANFSRAPLTTIGATVPGVTAIIDGNQDVLPSAYAWTPGSTHTIRIRDAIQPAGVVDQPVRYVFERWSNGGAVSQTLTAGAASTTITAQFQRQFLVSTYVSDPDNMFSSNKGTLAVSPVSGDCNHPSPRDCYYSEGTTLQFTLAASAPYVFTSWSGDLRGATAPGNLVVDDQKLVNANFQSPGRLTLAGVVSAANYLGYVVAPGQIVALFGYQFGPGAPTGLQLSSGLVSTVLAQTRVLFDGVAAPLIYVSANQISAVAPYAIAGKTQTSIRVEYQGRAGNAVVVPVGAAAPALFTFDSSGKGPLAALNQDQSVNTAANPAARGSVVVLYATGEGVTTPAGVDGKPAGVPLPKPVLPVSVTIAGRAAQVLYAGGAPGLVAGVLQINVRVPDDCPSGAVPVAVTVGGTISPDDVSIAVQ